MQRVIKRDGREVEFDKSKIIKAISQANQEIMEKLQAAYGIDNVKIIEKSIEKHSKMN